MDHYTSMRKHAPVPSSQSTQMADLDQSPSRTVPITGESDMRFTLYEELEETNLDSPPHLSTPIQHAQAPPRSTQMEKHDTGCAKRQKRSSIDDFHEKYLKLKKEEIDRFAAIEEKKLEDPYNINKCITTIEGYVERLLGAFMPNMINGNKGSTRMDYELGGITFQIRPTSNPKSSKKNKKATKTMKARGPAFSTFEDILLAKAWLVTIVDPICNTEQKGIKYWDKIWKDYRGQKEYVKPHPTVTKRNVASLQHRWGVVQTEVNQPPLKWDVIAN
ncbi:hypothetical protein D1007_55601 [Hordeum vulgare]|nr:hypothetical protein D1007_55601 [Hordeum vulgare]